MKVAIVGGGASGFFAAYAVKKHHSDAEVVIFEKSNACLAKVKISGGGRCNVTHNISLAKPFSTHYPRGGREMRKLLGHFGQPEVISFFQDHGVALHAEADGRMFPTTNNSQTIIDCLMTAIGKLGVEVKTGIRVNRIEPLSDCVSLEIAGKTEHVDHLILATGGSPNEKGFRWLDALNLNIVKPVPSLFTFNLGKHEITQLMGLSVSRAHVKIQGFDLVSKGPLLITHWGFSGPAILKLSAFAALFLAEKHYKFTVHINWVGHNEQELRDEVLAKTYSKSNKRIKNSSYSGIPKRLWFYLANRANLPLEKMWCELSKKEWNRLVNVLTNDQYACNGKTTFKEEFVTAGGIDLAEVNMPSMVLHKHPRISVAGELLNIDGITGGFNFQAAWTTGYLAGKHTS